jgi:hypothetical protein
MCCLDQPAIDQVPEAVPVSNPQSRLSVFPLVHGSGRQPDRTVLYNNSEEFRREKLTPKASFDV